MNENTIKKVIYVKLGKQNIIVQRKIIHKPWTFSPDLFSLCLTHASSKFSKFVYPLLGISLLGMNFKGNQIMNESI